MKKFFSLLICVLACLTCCLLGPQSAAAEFAEKPIAFVLVDHSGAVDGATYKEFRSPVKWAYYFPNYQVIDGGEAQHLVVQAINNREKLNAAKLAEIAEQAKVEGIVVARIYDMSEVYVHRGIWDDETYARVAAVADLLVYKKDGNKFLGKAVRERFVKPLGDYDKPDYTIKWALCKLVNTMEGRPII